MFIRYTVTIALMVYFVAFLLTSTDAICKHPKETKTWMRKSLTERAVASDIVIYGEVVSSPCWKPGYVKPTVLPTTVQILSGGNSSNVTSNATASTPHQVVNSTTAPTTVPYNCTSEFYSAVIKVICVIKGGSVPLFVALQGFGHGEDVCLDESYHDYHAYNQMKYLILLGRDKNPSSPRQFWINPVNHQSAITEIADESMLEPIFMNAGRNAHMPLGAFDATVHGMCKPYVSSAHVHCSAHAGLLLVLTFVFSFLITLTAK